MIKTDEKLIPLLEISSFNNEENIKKNQNNGL